MASRVLIVLSLLLAAAILMIMSSEMAAARVTPAVSSSTDLRIKAQILMSELAAAKEMRVTKRNFKTEECCDWVVDAGQPTCLEYCEECCDWVFDAGKPTCLEYCDDHEETKLIKQVGTEAIAKPHN